MTGKCKFKKSIMLLIFVGVSDMEMNREGEADSNDVTGCSHDDQPSVGMCVVFLMLYLCSHFYYITLW